MIDTDERALAPVLALVENELDDLDGMVIEWAEKKRAELRDSLAHLRRRLAQPDQSEPVATFVLSEASAGDEWPSGPLQLTPAGQRLSPGEYTVYTHPDRTQAPGEWVLVPREPTEAMATACLGVVDLTQSDPEDHRYDDGRSTVSDLYAAMIAAAPTPPSVPGKGGA